MVLIYLLFLQGEQGSPGLAGEAGANGEKVGVSPVTNTWTDISTVSLKVNYRLLE